MPIIERMPQHKKRIVPLLCKNGERIRDSFRPLQLDGPQNYAQRMSRCLYLVQPIQLTGEARIPQRRQPKN